jgi:anti-anti-sigma factor
MAVPYFDVHTRPESAAVRFSLVGDLTLASVDVLRDALEPRAVPGARLVVDLAELVFLDSTGLALLGTFHRRAAQEDFVFELDRVPPGVARMIDIACANWLPYRCL